MNTYLPQSSPVHYYTEARHEIKGALCAPRKIVGVLHVPRTNHFGFLVSFIPSVSLVSMAIAKELVI